MVIFYKKILTADRLEDMVRTLQVRMISSASGFNSGPSLCLSESIHCFKFKFKLFDIFPIYSPFYTASCTWWGGGSISSLS